MPSSLLRRIVGSQTDRAFRGVLDDARRVSRSLLHLVHFVADRFLNGIEHVIASLAHQLILSIGFGRRQSDDGTENR